MTQVVTKQGDMLDDLCWRQFRRWRESDLDAVAALNPDLVEVDYRLVPGQIVTFPDKAPETVDPDLENFWSVG